MGISSEKKKKNKISNDFLFCSKFIPEDSYRVGLSAEGYDADRVQVVFEGDKNKQTNNDDHQMVGLERPDGRMVVVVTNRHTVTPLSSSP